MLAQILFIMVSIYIPARSYETRFGKYSYFEDSAFEFVLNASGWSLACHSSSACSSDSKVQWSTERYELMSAGRGVLSTTVELRWTSSLDAPLWYWWRCQFLQRVDVDTFADFSEIRVNEFSGNVGIIRYCGNVGIILQRDMKSQNGINYGTGTKWAMDEAYSVLNVSICRNWEEFTEICSSLLICM